MKYNYKVLIYKHYTINYDTLKQYVNWKQNKIDIQFSFWETKKIVTSKRNNNL